MKVSTFAALLITVLMAGCTSSQRIILSQPIYNSQSGESPQLNNVSTSEVGKTIYTVYDYVVSPTIKLNNSYPTISAVIPDDKRLLAVRVKNSMAYVYHHQDDSEYGELFYLIDRNLNDKIDHYKTFSGTWRKIEPEITYSSSEPVLADKSGFKAELIYGGITDGVMEILYREFKDDYSEPVISQVAGYPVNSLGPTKITFKGAIIEILSAGVSEVKYRVLKGFN